MRFSCPSLALVTTLAVASRFMVSAAPIYSQWECNQAGNYWYGPDNYCDQKKDVNGWCFNGGDVHNSCAVSGGSPNPQSYAVASTGGWTAPNLAGKLTLDQMAVRYPVLAQWKDAIMSACGTHRSVPPNLVGAMIMQESMGNAWAVNWHDSPPAVGLMQIKNGPSDGYGNVMAGVGLLQQGFNQYGDWSMVLRWYNSGSPYWNGAGTYSYVDDILWGWCLGNKY